MPPGARTPETRLMDTKRRPLIAVAAGLAALAAAPAAQAASAEVSGQAVVYDLDLTNPFAQDLQVDFNAGTSKFVFTEKGNENRVLLKAKTGCEKGDGKVISCNGSGVTKVTVSTE